MTSFQIANASESSAAVADGVKNQVAKSLTFIDRVNDHIMSNSIDYIVAILLLIVGYYIAKFLKHFVVAILERAQYDKTVTGFLSQLVYYGVFFLFILSALNRMGVPAASFVAAIGAMGLAIGLALQNNLANFASGLLILMFKPFRIGDWVQVSGSADIVGRVDKIGLLYTTIMTRENRAILTPNSQLTSNAVINSSFDDTRIIRFDIGISYQNDHHKALAILKEIFYANELVLNRDNVEMGISSFGDNAVILSAYPRVGKTDVYTVFYAVMSDIKDRFDEEGISIPYPQRDLFLHYPSNPLSVQAEVLINPNQKDLKIEPEKNEKLGEVKK